MTTPTPGPFKTEAPLITPHFKFNLSVGDPKTFGRGYKSAISGICLEDEKGDIEITSSDGYAWKVDSNKLRTASSVLNDIISIPNLDSPPPLSSPSTVTCTIPFTHSAKSVHAFLHFITRHRVEAPNLTHQATLNDFNELLAMLDKYDCAVHLSAAEAQALMIVSRIPVPGTRASPMLLEGQAGTRVSTTKLDGSVFLEWAVKLGWEQVINLFIARENLKPFSDPFTLFCAACNAGSINVARVAIQKFRVSHSSLHAGFGTPENRHPANWSDLLAKQVGLDVYIAMVKACAEYRVNEKVDWVAVSRKFELKETKGGPTMDFDALEVKRQEELSREFGKRCVRGKLQF